MTCAPSSWLDSRQEVREERMVEASVSAQTEPEFYLEQQQQWVEKKVRKRILPDAGTLDKKPTIRMLMVRF